MGNPLYRERYRECRDSLEKPCIELPPKFDSESFNTSANTSASCAICVHIPAAPSRGTSTPRVPCYTRLIASTCRITCRMNMFLALRARHPATCPALKPRQAAEHPLSPGSLLYVLYVLYLTRQAAEPPLSPGSLLYVLYVLYTLYARNLYYMCYIGPYSTYSTYSKEPGESGCSVACLVRYSTYSTYSKEPGESEGSAGWRSVRAAFCMVFAWFL